MHEESSEFEPVEFALSPSLSPKIGHWANYPMTMARRLARNFGTPHWRRYGVLQYDARGKRNERLLTLMMMTLTALCLANGLETAPDIPSESYGSRGSRCLPGLRGERAGVS